MRVLFDHNLPHKLRPSLITSGLHEITTTSFMGWGHLKNGALLRAAEDSDFQVFVTGDRTMIHEQKSRRSPDFNRGAFDEQLADHSEFRHTDPRRN